MTKKYRFIIGLSPERDGLTSLQDTIFCALDAEHVGLKETPNACKANGVPDHYHEANSAGSQMARAWACLASALLAGGMPDALACKGIKYLPAANTLSGP